MAQRDLSRPGGKEEEPTCLLSKGNVPTDLLHTESRVLCRSLACVTLLAHCPLHKTVYRTVGQQIPALVPLGCAKIPYMRPRSTRANNSQHPSECQNTGDSGQKPKVKAATGQDLQRSAPQRCELTLELKGQRASSGSIPFK